MAPSARIVAVANCKGGCGKTTTAVNVAAELAARGRRTLLLDLDPQGHSSLALDARGSNTRATAHDLLKGKAVSREHLSSGHGLDILPADADFRATAAPLRVQDLAQALAPLAAGYDVVILDTPPALDAPLICALAAAHHALVPTQLTPLARNGVLRFAQAFFYAAAELNCGLRSFAIVPVQADLRTRVQQAALARLVVDFGPGRVFPPVRADTALAEAFDHAKPIGAYRPSSRGALDYQRVTDRLICEWLDGGSGEPAQVGVKPAPLLESATRGHLLFG